MVTPEPSAVKRKVPAHRLPLRERPTPAVNIRVHIDTYEDLRDLKDPKQSFDDFIKGLLFWIKKRKETARGRPDRQPGRQ